MLRLMVSQWPKRPAISPPLSSVGLIGTVRHGLFQLRDEGVPIDTIVEATEKALSQLDTEQRAQVMYHIDAPEWRTWSNPEFLLFDKGVRLDELPVKSRNMFLEVLKVTLSPEGYQKALGAMRVNGFLGELVQAPTILSEFSYNFVVFGKPSITRPWGISFYGHHLCLNIFLYKSQIVVAPWFTGAEPNLIDEGGNNGTRILEVEERLGLQLMQSLDPKRQAKAQIYEHLKDPAMPFGRWNQDDQRHLCGACQDNRIVPYEGILVSSMTETQRLLVVDILAQFLLYLPQRSRNMHLDQVKSFFHETYFSWIGGFDDQAAFYYRIQSPVIVVEFDHHSGVFLTNIEPRRFHIHTLLRMPNAGDYGHALNALVPVEERKFGWEKPARM